MKHNRSKAKRHTTRKIKINLAKTEFRYETYEGRSHLVVPLVMARTDVVMNGGLLDANEIHPQSWNGVPVTVGHPENESGSANDPDTHTKWTVGRVYNAGFDGTRLTGEAWIDVQRANKIYPGLINRLTDGTNMDVSTGYFSGDVPSAGVLNGKQYEVRHVGVKPDHLALLPDEMGACNFAEGCGVRANSKQGKQMKKNRNAVAAAWATIADALGITSKEPARLPVRKNAKKLTKAELLKRVDAALKKHARGADGDRRQMLADLVASDDTPFTPDHMEVLAAMDDAAFNAIHGKFMLPADKPDDEESDPNVDPDGDEDEAETEADGDEDEEETETEADEDEPSDEEKDADEEDKTGNQGLEQDDKPKKKKANAKGKQMAKPCGCKKHHDEDDATVYGRRLFKKHVDNLVAKVVKNTKFDEKEARALPLATLEKLADSVGSKAADYAARSAPVIVNDKTPDDVRAMARPSLVAKLQKKEAA